MPSKSKNFLEEIVKSKKLEFSLKTEKINILEVLKCKDEKSSKFRNVVERVNGRIKLIAELKFASPTNQHIGSTDQLIEKAKQYEAAGADAISIITEKHFFKGDISFVTKVKKNVSIPVLQKDFIIDPKQIFEAKKAGSDALLLIARIVNAKALKSFVKLCLAAGIEPVVEINNEEDLEKAIESDTNIIAVNARDLETFTIDLKRACLLMKRIPDHFVKLGFSGIHSADEVLQYQNAGAKGVLVGTSLMKTNNIKNFIKSLLL